MTGRSRRRAIRVYRLLQSWPLWYVGAALVGVFIWLAGAGMNQQSWIHFGVGLMVPGFALLGWLILVLSIAAVIRLCELAYALLKRLIRP